MKQRITYFKSPKMKALNLINPSDKTSSQFNFITKSFNAFVTSPRKKKVVKA